VATVAARHGAVNARKRERGKERMPKRKRWKKTRPYIGMPARLERDLVVFLELTEVSTEAALGRGIWATKCRRAECGWRSAGKTLEIERAERVAVGSASADAIERSRESRRSGAVLRGRFTARDDMDVWICTYRGPSG
jgi:hypothetical protein